MTVRAVLDAGLQLEKGNACWRVLYRGNVVRSEVRLTDALDLLESSTRMWALVLAGERRLRLVPC